MELPAKYLEVVKQTRQMKLTQIVSRVVKLAEMYDELEEECLNLDACHSVMNQDVRKLGCSNLEGRSLIAAPRKSYHGGNEYFELISLITADLAKKLFKANFAECRLPSGSMSIAVALYSLTDLGGNILALPTDYKSHSGHPTVREEGYSGYRGLKITDIPLTGDKLNVDVNMMAETISNKEEKPQLIVIGSGMMLFPYPLTKIKKVADEIGAKILYDGSHVLGLIAGKRFQDPLREGADVLVGSTQKTLSAPIGGIILTNNEEIWNKVCSKMTGANMLSTYMGGKIAGMAVTFADLLEFGVEFADQIIRNAKALAKAMDEEGFDVLGKDRGYTESHTVVADISDLIEGDEAAYLLEKANLLAACYHLGWEPTHKRAGLRLGTTVLTRYGMKELEMKQVANFLRRVLVEKEQEKVRREIAELRAEFKEVKYSAKR